MFERRVLRVGKPSCARPWLVSIRKWRSERRDPDAWARSGARASSLSRVLLSTFAVVAGVFALVGMHGVIAYAVRQRQREIAVRIAMGASTRSVTTLFVRQGAVDCCGSGRGGRRRGGPRARASKSAVPSRARRAAGAGWGRLALRAHRVLPRCSGRWRRLHRPRAGAEGGVERCLAQARSDGAHYVIGPSKTNCQTFLVSGHLTSAVQDGAWHRPARTRYQAPPGPRSVMGTLTRNVRHAARVCENR